MHRSPLSLTMVFVFLASCGGIVGDRTTVQGTGLDDLLKLRSGPSLGHNVILGLPDGTELTRRNCVTELGQRWCEVALADAPRITGYVSADYLTQQ